MVDIYDALATDRPRRVGMSRDAATAIIMKERGEKLCPCVVDAVEFVNEVV
jgi:HD-GYP domain-containing protein (c-di-GMP phosphodiesterase class II)